MSTRVSLYGDLSDKGHWYALRTRARHEKKVAERIKEKGITCYVPLKSVLRRWSDRNKLVVEPLFTCYVFVHLALRNRFAALETDGVLYLVSFNGIPAPIPHNQIDAIERVLANNSDVQSADYFTRGQKVEVVSGPLRGLRGTMITIQNNNKLVICIDAVRQAMAVQIHPGEVRCI